MSEGLRVDSVENIDGRKTSLVIFPVVWLVLLGLTYLGYIIDGIVGSVILVVGAVLLLAYSVIATILILILFGLLSLQRFIEVQGMPDEVLEKIDRRIDHVEDSEQFTIDPVSPRDDPELAVVQATLLERRETLRWVRKLITSTPRDGER